MLSWIDRNGRSLSPEDILDEPDAEIVSVLNSHAVDRYGSGYRILDFGCGIGMLVGCLRSHGWDAYGIDNDPVVIDRGKILSQFLFLVSDGSQAPFGDGYFDAVVLDQVIEHVAEIDGVAREIARLLAPGGTLFVRYPAKWCPIEPHVMLPFVHWLPKKHQRAWISWLLRFGFSTPNGPEMPYEEHVESVASYLHEHTFYRSPKVVSEAFARAGIELDFYGPTRKWLVGKVGALAIPHAVAAANTFHHCRAIGSKL